MNSTPRRRKHGRDYIRRAHFGRSLFLGLYARTTKARSILCLDHRMVSSVDHARPLVAETVSVGST